MVGHTHEDIDQMFSRISLKLKQTSTTTYPKLQKAIEDSYTPKPTIEFLKSIWDCKGQFSGLRTITGLKAPHVFRFKLGSSGNVVASVKGWPLKDEVYRTIEVPDIPDVSDDLGLVPPQLQKMTPLCESMLEELASHNAAGRLSSEDVDWWKHYLEKIKSPSTDDPVIPFITTLPTYTERQHRTTELDSSLRQALNSQIEKLQKVSELTLSNRRIRL